MDLVVTFMPVCRLSFNESRLFLSLLTSSTNGKYSNLKRAHIFRNMKRILVNKFGKNAIIIIFYKI